MGHISCFAISRKNVLEFWRIEFFVVEVIDDWCVWTARVSLNQSFHTLPISINAFFSWSMSDQLTEVASIKSPSFFDIDDFFFSLLLNLITIRLYAVDLKGL